MRIFVRPRGQADGVNRAAADVGNGRPAPSPPSGLPGTAVAAEESGRLVVVDVATGEVHRTLMTFSDLRTEAPEGGHAFPRDITLTPDGTVAYLDWCCEPAAGAIRRVPTVGGDGAGADSIAHGYAPSVSPNGASVTWGTYTSGITIRTGDQQRLVPGPERPTDLFYSATAWVDDRRVAYVRSTPGGHVTQDQVYIHDIAASDLLGDRLLAEVKDLRDLVRRGDGSLVWVGSDGVGHVLDPRNRPGDGGLRAGQWRPRHRLRRDRHLAPVHDPGPGAAVDRRRPQRIDPREVRGRRLVRCRRSVDWSPGSWPRS